MNVSTYVIFSNMLNQLNNWTGNTTLVNIIAQWMQKENLHYIKYNNLNVNELVTYHRNYNSKHDIGKYQIVNYRRGLWIAFCE